MAGGFIRFSHLGLSQKQLTDRTDAKKINDAIQKQMESIWVRAGAKFAESLSREVLVETGESFGSLIPLARFTGATINLRITKQRKRPQLDPTTGTPIPGTRRSVQSGISRGVKAFGFSFQRNKYQFTFSIPVFQFALHDAGAGFNGATIAKDATGRALQAAEKFARKAFQEEVGLLVENWLSTGGVKTLVI